MDGFSDPGITGGYGKRAPLTALEGGFDANDTVRGVFEGFGSCFQASSERARFLGRRTRDSIRMESQPVSGQVVSVEGTLSPDGNVFEGTYSVTGGCAHGTSGRLTGRSMDLTGTWSGRMGAIQTVFDLQMAATADPDGNRALTGTARFADTSCFAGATITRRARGRVLFPDVISETHDMELIGEVDQSGTRMFVTFTLVRGRCPELDFDEGLLVRQ